MAEVSRAPQQFKQPSRKGKKAWRKNVDVTQVQTGLEDVRDEVIKGGILSEKPAEELFLLDTTGAPEVREEYRKKNKPLRAEEIIAARNSAIPAIDSRKRKGAEGIVAPSSKRNKNGTYVSHRDLQRLKAIAAGEAERADIIAASQADHDPWAVQPAPVDPRFSFLKEKKPIREPATKKHAPVSLAASGKPFAAVKKPDAGKSYNPQFDDWESLIAREGAKEVEAETKRLRQAKEEDEALEKALAEAARPDPVSDEEYESAWESEWEGIQSGGEEAWLGKKRPERKTQPERNKAKKRKEAERAAKADAQMKKRDEQQKRIKELAKEVQKKEQAREAARKTAVAEGSSDESGEEEVLRRRKFGKMFIPEAPLELVLADELQDSLRALRPEGNLLKDRFRNLLVNGKIEARARMQHKKPKRSVTEKWTYKDWKLQ